MCTLQIPVIKKIFFLFFLCFWKQLRIVYLYGYISLPHPQYYQLDSLLTRKHVEVDNWGVSTAPTGYNRRLKKICWIIFVKSIYIHCSFQNLKCYKEIYAFIQYKFSNNFFITIKLNYTLALILISYYNFIYCTDPYSY